MADDFQQFVQGGIQAAPSLYGQTLGALQQATNTGNSAYNEATSTIRGLGQTNQGAPLMALAAQMFAPTKTGGFGESLGGGLSAYGNAITQQRAETMDRAQKLAALQLAQAKMQQDAAMGIWGMNTTRMGMGTQAATALGGVSDYQRIRDNMGISDVPSTPGGARDARAGVPPASGAPASGLPAVAGGIPGQTPPAGTGGPPMPLGGAPARMQPPAGSAPPAAPPRQESGPTPPQRREGVIDITEIPAAQADLRVIQDYRQRPGNYQGPGGAAIYKQAQENLERILKSGVAVDRNGVVGAIAGSLEDPAHKGRVKTAEESAVQAAQAPYKFEEGIDPRTGAKYKFSLSQLVGAGAPPLMTADPKDTDERLSQATKSEEKMLENLQQRQIVRERLDKLRSISQTLEQGAFATNKAAILAAAKSIGLPLSKEAAENPALVQTWLKNSTANVFDQAKALGGRILLAEIQGLKEANANPNLEPGANMAIINQGLGLLDYEDQYHKDYFGWRKENRRNPYIDEFANDWISKNSPNKFVEEQNKRGSARGVPQPPKFEAGQTYNRGGKQYRFDGTHMIPVQ